MKVRPKMTKANSHLEESYWDEFAIGHAIVASRMTGRKERNMKSTNACAVDDGQTLTIIARPAEDVANELNALPKQYDAFCEPDPYTEWCQANPAEMTTGYSEEDWDAVHEQIKLRGLPVIRYDPRERVWR
jgi:hypothetical protein